MNVEPSVEDSVAERAGSVGLIGLGACIALGLVASAALISSAAIEVKRENNALQVKGFAQRAIESDLAIWSGSFTTRSAKLESAYQALEEDRKTVVELLRHAGAGEHELQPVHMAVVYGRNEKGHRTNAIEGYTLTQTVKLTSKDIDRVERISQQAAGLVKVGVEFSSNRPQYLYTQLGALKIEMLSAATADARRRAQTLAEQSGGALGSLLSARQGVFQITSAHSTEVSDYGRNDTSSRQKSIKAVVTVRFAVAR